MNKGFLL